MSNLARKLQQEKQYEQNNSTQAVKSIKEKRSWLTPGEKGLGLIFGAMVCFGAVQIISAQSSIYEVNRDIQSMETTIMEQQKVNNDLNNEISELTNYERIMKKAGEQGLKLNENNVKVVQEQ